MVINIHYTIMGANHSQCALNPKQSNLKDLICLGDLKIPLVSECKYLGLTINEENCDQDIHRQIRKTYPNANILLIMFSKCSIDVKCYLFKMYCSSVWYDSSKPDI